MLITLVQKIGIIKDEGDSAITFANILLLWIIDVSCHQ